MLMACDWILAACLKIGYGHIEKVRVIAISKVIYNLQISHLKETRMILSLISKLVKWARPRSCHLEQIEVSH